ncbi:MAG: hypothetical protein MUP97_06130 [Acidimicrobiia bacterium]|jgi:hypothetical protein|nr:hypothetical protein [Acidimicrobiia bacterium]
MAFVVARPGRRFEIRESRATPHGPRARTLATFRVLDDAVVARATERSASTLDVAALRASARRAGAPVAVDNGPDRAARALLAQLAGGHRPSPVLTALLADTLAGSSSGARQPAIPDAARAVVPWLDATPAQRGHALRDLLLLADRLPPPRTKRARFPKLVPAA